MNTDLSPEAIASPLAEHLQRFSDALTEPEIENYKLLLCMAAGGLAPRGRSPGSQQRASAFRTVLKCLRELQPDGTIWRGNPSFLTDEMLAALQRESLTQRDSAKETDRYLLVCGGNVADQFALNLDLASLVESNFPGARPTGIASYIYYDQEGQGLDPHVDTEIYSVNVILMLGHRYKSKPSHLLLYLEDEVPQKILLEPGELIILNAGSVVHAREDMSHEEAVSILTIGFQYGAT